MLSRLAGLALFLLLLGCSTTRPAGDDKATQVRERSLRLGIVGDQTLADDLDAAYAVLARGVEELARYHREVAALDAVVHTGDLVESAEAPEAVAARFAAAAAVLDRLPVPWYPAAGDHDVNPPRYEPGSGDRSRRELFVRLVGERVPAAEDGDGLLYYAVDLGGFRLIVLDSQEVAHAEPRWGDVFLARIGVRQLAWLKAELAGDDRPAVLALHQPQWLTWSGWQRVHELLRRHPVAAVASGHLHHPQDGGTLDGVRYLTVGATGGATRQGSRAAGDVQHVTVLEVTAAGDTTVTLLPLDGQPLALPGRRDMERAQALDVMLGTLWDLAARTPLHLAAGELVADCATLEPTRIALDRLGNPIDRDVTLTIALAESVEVAEAAFAAGFCRDQANGGQIGERTTAAHQPTGSETATCVLPAPSPNVLYSHPSGVELAPDPPLWQSTLALATSSPPPTVDLRLTLSWDPEAASAPLWLERTVALPITPCP